MEHMIKREKMANNNAALAHPGAMSESKEAGVPKNQVSLGTNLLVKNFEKIISRFEERDPVFHSVSRAKIDSLHKIHRATPPPGSYNPKIDNFKVRSQSQQARAYPRISMINRSSMASPMGE